MIKNNPNWKILEMKKSGKLYNLHSYWTKQSTEVIKKFLDFYTSEGDNVLDCFCGTGTTGIAAKEKNRIAYLFDLSPICCEISKGYTTKISNEDNLLMEFKKFKDFIEKEAKDIVYYKKNDKKFRIKYILISRDYECPKCNNISNSFDEEVSLLRGEIDHYNALCDKCGFAEWKKFTPKNLHIREITFYDNKKKVRLKPDEDFINKLNSIKNVKYPLKDFFGKEPRRNYKYGVKKVYHLYSKHNRYILHKMLKYINSIEDAEVKQIFKFVFSSILFNCSLLSAYTKYENTTYRTGTYYIPRIIKDNNPLDAFYSKFNLIVKTLLNTYKENPSVNIYNKSATNMSELHDSQMDYVFIDPPYSDVINYSELNLVWEAWLDLDSSNDEEIIVNHEHNKTEQYYEKMMSKVFSEIYRVLKDDGYMTIIFHHPKPSHWRLLQKAVLENGFELMNNKPIQIRSSSKTHSQINTKKIVQGFLAMNFHKLKDKRILDEIGSEDYKKLVEDVKIEAIKKGYSSKPDMYDYIITKLFSKYKIQDFII